MANPTRKRFTISPEEAGQRLDAFLTIKGAGPSRSFLQKIIADNGALVNGKIAKAGCRLVEGDTIEIDIPEPKILEVNPQDIALDILYEDDDLIVVNKPRGLVVHPAAGNHDGTLVNALMWHCTNLSGIGGIIRPGIVHRIDKDTSGIIVAAKNDRAHLSLAAQFKQHSITRVYLAIVVGIPPADSGTINAPIGRHPSERKKMAVVPGGRNAVTHYRVLERFQHNALMEARLETGRTHQIRVHMTHLGYPLLGDIVYGKARSRCAMLSGQALHASVLGFVHPGSGQYLEFTVPMPADMQELAAKLRLE
ncbi:MAG TPA: RNA pseudouridine synthase [Firmicutes bacterium]|jgi:23S rRNA pseudouridine1911/1915/1917 synthase|nr:RNA pseudouridine synthase [Bacillota bacterium]